VWSLLLLVATVRSFAHMPLGLSNCNTALITINGNFSSQVEVVSCSYIAGNGMLLCCAEWHKCVLCGLIVYFMGGQLELVFDRDRLENFLITWDRPVSNKVTNTILYAKVEYHMCKYSCTIIFDAQTEGKVSVTPTNHDCHTVICRTCLWSAIAIGTKEYTWPTNWWTIFVNFLEFWLKSVLFWFLSIQCKIRRNRPSDTWWSIGRCDWPSGHPCLGLFQHLKLHFLWEFWTFYLKFYTVNLC